MARLELEAKTRAEGSESFQISERMPSGEMVAAARREEYFPVYYLEPLAGNHAAFGFDLASESVRREALYAARDSGGAYASTRVKLVQDMGDQWSVLIFIPVYDGTPTTVADRRARLRGVISSVFRLQDLLSAVGPPLSEKDDVALMLLNDIAPGESELLFESRLRNVPLAPAFRHVVKLQATGGRHWRLIATPAEATIAAQRTALPLWCLVLGSFITAWLTYYLVRLSHEHARIEERVRVRTRELREQSRALEASNKALKIESDERRQLQEEFAHATHNEQRRLGNELHDSLGQQVAAATLLAVGIQQRLSPHGKPVAPHVTRLLEGLQTAQAHIRALSKGLLPVAVDSRGLGAALAELVAGSRSLGGAKVAFIGA